MVAIVPSLIDAPELTTRAIILWVVLCVFVSLLDQLMATDEIAGPIATADAGSR
jgi:hypothetical protein